MEMAGLFLTDAPRLMDEIRGAIHRQDARGVERAAHSLKGSLGYLNAHQAASEALRLETFGAEGDLSKAAEVLQTLEAEVVCLSTELSSAVPELAKQQPVASSQ